MVRSRITQSQHHSTTTCRYKIVPYCRNDTSEGTRHQRWEALVIGSDIQGLKDSVEEADTHTRKERKSESIA